MYQTSIPENWVVKFANWVKLIIMIYMHCCPHTQPFIRWVTLKNLINLSRDLSTLLQHATPSNNHTSFLTICISHHLPFLLPPIRALHPIATPNTPYIGQNIYYIKKHQDHELKKKRERDSAWGTMLSQLFPLLIASTCSQSTLITRTKIQYRTNKFWIMFVYLFNNLIL